MVPAHDVIYGAIVLGAVMTAAFWKTWHRDKIRQESEEREWRDTLAPPDKQFEYLYDDGPDFDRRSQEMLEDYRAWYGGGQAPVPEGASAHDITEPDIEEISVNWRNLMAQVVKIPAALLRDGTPVVEGDLLPIGDPAQKRQVKVINPIPNEDGGIQVQEVYLTTPEELGCIYQQPKVRVDMDENEAAALMKYYEQSQSGSGESKIGPTTQQFAGPVFGDIQKGLAR